MPNPTPSPPPPQSHLAALKAKLASLPLESKQKALVEFAELIRRKLQDPPPPR